MRQRVLLAPALQEPSGLTSRTYSQTSSLDNRVPYCYILGVMTNSLTMSAGRYCSRCGQELTDPASRECGVGPICRKLDNKLLAKVIPANPAVAKGAWSKISFLTMPAEVVATMALVDKKVATMPEVDDDTFGTDWRETVKKIEWVLSHKIASDTRGYLYAFVQSLGYAGLVSMWLGEAASGKCTVTFLDGRLWMAGPRNKAGQTAIKAVAGRKFHQKDATSPARWSVPASQWEAFEKVIVNHWPNNEGLTEAVLAAKAAWVASFQTTNYPSPVVTTTYSLEGETPVTLPGIGTVMVPPPAPAKKEPKCWVTVDGENLTIRTPFSWDFVNKLKTLPYKERAWNPVAKCWTAKVKHGDFVKSLIAEVFGEDVEF